MTRRERAFLVPTEGRESPGARAPSLRLTPNLFGSSFGLCGLAQCWSAADELVDAPSRPAACLWLAAASLYVVTLVAYVRNVVTTGRVRTELVDPIYGPFTSLVMVRLVSQPQLPPPLQPTLAILVAPPVVAGNAWAQLAGDPGGGVGVVLAGYGIAMVAVQVSLFPAFRRVPFGPGWWAFSFSYAAVVLLAIRWLGDAGVGADPAWTNLLLATVTAGMALLVVRSARGLLEGTYLPREPASANASHHLTEPRPRR